jgi:uncharacterized repeat protein (TIGR02543 family)
VVYDTMTADTGTTITAPTAPSKTGYDFGGWYPTAACDTTAVTFPYTVTGDETLYAGWMIKSSYLSAINLTPGASLTRAFSKTRYSYTVKLTEHTGSVTITPVKENSNATITITKGSLALSLKNGQTKAVKIKVAYPGKSSHTYTLSVTRAKSTDTDLSDIAHSAGVLSPVFDPAVKAYTLTLDENTGSVTITLKKDLSLEDSSLEKIYIDGRVRSSRTYNVSTGHSTGCTIKVVAQSGASKTYKVTIKRDPSTNAYLSKLRTNSSRYSITPSFVKDSPGYAVFLPENVSSVTLYATKENGYATVRFDGRKASSRTYSVGKGQSLPPVDIQVTAQDGTTVRHYYVTICRAPSISSFSATPKAGSYAVLTPGGVNVMTFKWKQYGAGHIKIEEALYGTSDWKIVYETDETASGTYTYAWDGKVGGSYLAAGKYRARIQVTSPFGTSLYDTLNFKILP